MPQNAKLKICEQAPIFNCRLLHLRCATAVALGLIAAVAIGWLTQNREFSEIKEFNEVRDFPNFPNFPNFPKLTNLLNRLFCRQNGAVVVHREK